MHDDKRSSGTQRAFDYFGMKQLPTQFNEVRSMVATTHHAPVHWSRTFRWLGRASGVALFVTWTGYVFAEAFRGPAPLTTPLGLYLQAAALAVVFAGYAVGWKRELAGAVLTGIGLVAFVVSTVADSMIMPTPATAWFAAPAALYALAHYFEQHEPIVRTANA